MVLSMTGFGRGEATTPFGKFIAEVHSVNRKHFEINVNLAKNFLALEPRLRSLVAESISRGRINVQVNFERSDHQMGKVIVNEELARNYLHTYQLLKQEFGLKGEIDLGMLVHSQDVVSYQEVFVDPEEGWPAVEEAVAKALAGLNQMRSAEGKALLKDISGRLKLVGKSVAKIHKLAPKTIKRYEKNLLKKIREADKGASKEEELIMKEIALFADRIDVSEELTRLESHLSQFDGLLGKREPVGRTLDFILQEMHREINTIGSKANNAEISREVVFIKSELEKIREQVQNVE